MAEITYDTEKVRSMRGLDALLKQIESGGRQKPDWIEMKGDANLGRLPTDELAALITRIHPLVRRGFEANNVKIKGKANKLDYWKTIAKRGFHDFGEECWMKCFDSPFVEDYDYITAYQEGGLEALDPYMVYSSVLGTWDYSIEDFLLTDHCRDVKTVVEPLAGTAEFCYSGHFHRPNFKYVMFDLDKDAERHVASRQWLPGSEYTYIIGNAVHEQTWKEVREASEGKSLSYVGKQSQNFFNVKELMSILQWGTTYTDYLMVEVAEPYTMAEEPEIDKLTRKEQRAAGFKVALEDGESSPCNPLTNEMDFELVTWDKEDRRVLFNYDGWIGWQAPTITAMAEYLDLDARYYHSEECEFLPIREGTDTADVHENNTFLMFTKK